MSRWPDRCRQGQAGFRPAGHGAGHGHHAGRARRAHRGQPSARRRMEFACGTGHAPGPCAHPLLQAADGCWPGAPAAGGRAGGPCRSPALRRHPCIPRRRDRPRPDRQDREQGPAQPQGEPPPRGAWRGRTAVTIGGTGHPPASDAGFAEPGRRSSERALSPRAFGPDGPIRGRTSYSSYSRKSYRGGSRASISARGIRLLTTNTPFSTWLM